jgi:hypothetical protein
MRRKWDNRSIYGEILLKMIRKEYQSFKSQHEPVKKSKIAHSIAYLIQTANSLINSERGIEERIERLEQLVGLKK